MKATLFALFVVLLMVGCGESAKPSEGVDTTDTDPKKDAIETAIDWSKLEDRDGVKYLPNEETPFTGRAVMIHENGQKWWEGNYKEGKRDGLWIYYTEDGKERSRLTLKDGEQVFD